MPLAETTIYEVNTLGRAFLLAAVGFGAYGIARLVLWALKEPNAMGRNPISPDWVRPKTHVVLACVVAAGFVAGCALTIKTPSTSQTRSANPFEEFQTPIEEFGGRNKYESFGNKYESATPNKYEGG